MSQTLSAELDELITGAINLRDLGGIPVKGGMLRRGLLFRSGMMHGISSEGLEQLARNHNVRTVIDLRNDMELAEDGLCDFDSAGIRHCHVPVITDATHAADRSERIHALASGQIRWGGLYLQMLRQSPATFRQVFEIAAADEALSLVFHCAGGRDRTGVTAMLLLSALGAEDDVVAADYARTGPILQRRPERFERTMRDTGLSMEQMAAMVGGTLPETIHELLGEVRQEWGSTEGYLEWAGLDLAVIDELRGRLVEIE